MIQEPCFFKLTSAWWPLSLPLRFDATAVRNEKLKKVLQSIRPLLILGMVAQARRFADNMLPEKTGWPARCLATGERAQPSIRFPRPETFVAAKNS